MHAHRLDNITKVLAEMKRVLKPDGYFIIQENFSDGEQTEAQKTEIFQQHWDAEIDTLLGKAHNKTLTKQKIKNIANNIKLKEVKISESTHPVKCIFCMDKFECENPRNAKTITQSPISYMYTVRINVAHQPCTIANLVWARKPSAIPRALRSNLHRRKR